MNLRTYVHISNLPCSDNNVVLYRIGLVDRRLSFENLLTVFLDLGLSVLSTSIPDFGGYTWSTNLPQ